MRISVHDPDRAWEYADITLDGVPLKYVVAADDAEGWVEEVKLDESGYVLLDGDEIVTGRRYGAVAITFRGPDEVG